MNKLFKNLSFIALFVLLAVGFGAKAMRAGQASAAPQNLPYGLTMQDTMATVEQKLGQPKIAHALQAGWEAGLPDEGGSPDHVHYWAIYKRFGVTVIYNTPSTSDKSATVYDIIVDD